MVGITAKGDRQLADLFDQFVSGNAFLLADDITQNASQKTDVFYQRAFVVFGAFGGLGFWRGDHGGLDGGWHRTVAPAMLAFSVPQDY